MLKVEQSIHDGVLTLKIEGRIDEHVNFDRFLKQKPKQVDIYSSGITRINSIGVGTWCKFFHNLRIENVKLRFFEVSPILVDQMNYIRGFIEPDELESVCVPFECRSCGTEVNEVYQKRNLSANAKVMTIKCPKCQKNLEFDDPTYFDFLQT